MFETFHSVWTKMEDAEYSREKYPHSSTIKNRKLQSGERMDIFDCPYCFIKVSFSILPEHLQKHKQEKDGLFFCRPCSAEVRTFRKILKHCQDGTHKAKCSYAFGKVLFDDEEFCTRLVKRHFRGFSDEEDKTLGVLNDMRKLFANLEPFEPVHAKPKNVLPLLRQENFFPDDYP